ncbi:MAG: hypothetical protein ACLQDQ_05655 [Myxococcaceae bacterium]
MTPTASTLQGMREAISRYDLLRHPFYQAWSAGTLTVAALAIYAREYGAFIDVLEWGWNALDEPEGAAIERHHVDLWKGFARALGTTVLDVAALGAGKSLLEEATRSFTTPPEAAGALYAFEAQQPSTARSKLKGLDTYYRSLPAGVRPYFEAHACETGEEALLQRKLARMTEAEQERATAACSRMAKALWDALTSIHAAAAC